VAGSGLVKRHLSAAKISQLWYGDGTRDPTGGHAVAGFGPYMWPSRGGGARCTRGVSSINDAVLACGALVMAVAVRGGQMPELILHTYSEYTAGAFRQDVVS
jgi:hypothetical protein